MGAILHFYFKISLSMKILMVCLGNICRSPLAEGILQAKLPDGFSVDSAGTISQHEGELPDARAIKTAAQHGTDISMQRSRPITKKDIKESDRIYCMDLNNLQDVLSVADEADRGKIKLFLEAAGVEGDNFEVPDPYWGDMADFEAVYKMLDNAADRIAAQLIKEKNH